MTKYKKYKIFTFFFILLFFMSANAHAQNPAKITVALNEKPSFPNRAKKGFENSKNPGVAFETLRLIEKEIKIPITFVRLPYKRCLYELEHSKVDAVMTGSYKLKREKSGVYPKKNGKPDSDRRVYYSSYYLYAQKNSQIKWDGKHFKGIKRPVGAEIGFSIIDDLEKMGLKIETFTNAQACFKSLAKGRLLGVAAHETTGNRFLHHYKNLIRLYPPINSKAYYLLFSHQFYFSNTELAEKIWDIISTLRESTNEWQTLKEKYFLMDFWPEGEL